MDFRKKRDIVVNLERMFIYLLNTLLGQMGQMGQMKERLEPFSTGFFNEG